MIRRILHGVIALWIIVGAGSLIASCDGAQSSREISGRLGLKQMFENEEPQKFHLLTPPNGAVGLSLAPKLTWESSPNAISYMVEVDDDESFDDPILYSKEINAAYSPENEDQMPHEAELELPLNLLNGSSKYFWRVTANNRVNDVVAVDAPFSFETRSSWGRKYSYGQDYKLFVTDISGVSPQGAVVSMLVNKELSEKSAGIVMRLGSTGAVAWARIFSGTGDGFYPYEIKQDPNGGYVMAATEYSSMHNLMGWIIKLDSSGGIINAVAMGDANDHYEMRDVISYKDGYLCAGNIFSDATGSAKAWIVKLDGDLNEVWQKSIDLPGWNTRLNSFALDEDGGVAIAGALDDSIIDRADGCLFWGDAYLDGLISDHPIGNSLWVSKLDSGGEVEWSQSFGRQGDVFGWPSKIIRNGDSGYLISASYVFDKMPFAGVMRIDSKGQLQGEQWYPSVDSGFEKGVSAVRVPDNSSIATFAGSKDDGLFVRLMRTGSSGDVYWQRAIEANAWENVMVGGVDVTADGSVFLASTYAFPVSIEKQGMDAVVFFMDPNGETDLNDESPLIISEKEISVSLHPAVRQVSVGITTDDVRVERIPSKVFTENCASDISVTSLSE